MNNHSRQLSLWMDYTQGIDSAPIAYVLGTLLAKELSANDKQFNKL